jgi:hypothetical protein
MTWDLKSEELEALLKLPAPERYAYFVKRCADWEEVWCLRDDRGWVTAEDDQGRMLVPGWPHAEYARACAIDAWEGSEPVLIELDDWVEGWLSDLEIKGHMVSVFPLPAGSGVAVAPSRLRRDLEAEISLYE